VIWEVFTRQKWKKKISKKIQVFILGFSVGSQNIEGQLKICSSYLIYSQIWLNFPRDACQFFYTFLWMIATFGYKQRWRALFFVFLPCSQCVPNMFSFCSLEVPNSTLILSHRVCPKFNSHVYKLKRYIGCWEMHLFLFSNWEVQRGASIGECAQCSKKHLLMGQWIWLFSQKRKS
jgi:hypothetical protein